MDYSAIQLNAYNMIIANGCTVSLKVSTMGTYTASSDSYASHVTSFSTYAIVTNCTVKEWGDLVMIGDKQFILPTVGLPRLDEMGEKRRYEIIYRTNSWVPVNMVPVEPGGLALLYKIQGRQ